MSYYNYGGGIVGGTIGLIVGVVQLVVWSFFLVLLVKKFRDDKKRNKIIEKIKSETPEEKPEELLLEKNKKGIRYFNPIFFPETYIYPFMVRGFFVITIAFCLLFIFPLMFLLFFLMLRPWLVGFDDDKGEFIVSKKDGLFGLWVTTKRYKYDEVEKIFLKKKGLAVDVVAIKFTNGKVSSISTENSSHCTYAVDMINSLLRKRKNSLEASDSQV